MHKTQPWRWRVDGDRLDLFADRARQVAEAALVMILLHDEIAVDPTGTQITWDVRLAA